MSTAFFAQLAIGGAEVGTLTDEYLHWALGTDASRPYVTGAPTWVFQEP